MVRTEQRICSCGARNLSRKESRARSSRGRTFRIPRKRRLLDTLDGSELSSEEITQLRNLSSDWTLSYGVWSNRRGRYDSRSREWRDLIEWLLSSNGSSEAFGIIIQAGLPPYGEAAPPSSLIDGEIRSITAIETIAASLLCEDPEIHTTGTLVAKLSPVTEGIPFILGLYYHPKPDSHEARFPVGSYITSLRIYVLNVHIAVDIFRQ